MLGLLEPFASGRNMPSILSSLAMFLEGIADVIFLNALSRSKFNGNPWALFGSLLFKFFLFPHRKSGLEVPLLILSLKV